MSNKINSVHLFLQTHYRSGPDVCFLRQGSDKSRYYQAISPSSLKRLTIAVRRSNLACFPHIDGWSASKGNSWGGKPA